MRKNYRQILKVGMVVLLTIIGIVLLVILLRNFLFAPPTILQEIPSPDGKYVAYVYESNGGATTGFIYHVSVLKAGQKLRRGNGNVYINEGHFSVDWISDRVLQITHYKSVLIGKQRTQKYGVKIQYQYFGSGAG